jgi:outer membrane protein TolC
MKKIILFLLISAPAWAQSVDYNKIILPDQAKAVDFGEKLVQVAWRNHPSNEIYRREVNVAEFDVRQSTTAWLDLVRFTGNLNEFTINPEADPFNRGAFYPRYNVSFSMSLGQFFSIPYNTKRNKERVIIAQSNVNAQKLAVRNSVLKAYNLYLMLEKAYKVQSQLLMDNETSHKLIEQRFKNGETTFETYSLSLNNFSQLTISNMEAEMNYKNAKLDLEQLIGTRLEDVR